MQGLESITACCNAHSCPILPAELLSKHTTFRIGGACQAMVQIANREGLQAILQCCQEQHLPWVVLGNGSNILAADEGYHGIVLQLGRAFSNVRQLDETTLFCEAGATLSAVGKIALEACLTGMECLAGIPGTIGGAVYMNAGAYGGEMKDVLVSVTYLTREGEIVTEDAANLSLSYRHSIFEENGGCILSAKFHLKRGDSAAIKARMDELMQKRIDKQPLDKPSAGSTFKRPVGAAYGAIATAVLPSVRSTAALW